MIIYGFAGILANQNDIQTTFGILQRINSLIGGLFLIIPLIIVMFPQILYGLPVRDLSKAMPVTKEPYNTKKYIQSTVKNQESFKILSQKSLNILKLKNLTSNKILHLRNWLLHFIVRNTTSPTASVIFGYNFYQTKIHQKN